jgi:hypothetical protein
MKLHNWHSIGWVIIVLLFILWEVIGLANRADAHQPFTFFVRKIVGTWTSPLWFLALGFLLWLIVHFLFVHDH